VDPSTVDVRLGAVLHAVLARGDHAHATKTDPAIAIGSCRAALAGHALRAHRAAAVDIRLARVLDPVGTRRRLAHAVGAGQVHAIRILRAVLADAARLATGPAIHVRFLLILQVVVAAGGHAFANVAEVAYAVAVLATGLGRRARRAFGTSAIDVGLRSVLHVIGAERIVPGVVAS